MSSNTFLFNANIRHQIFLQRFAGSQVKVYKKAVVKLRRELKRQLRLKEATAMSKAQTSLLLAQLRVLSRTTYKEANKKALASIEEFAEYEAGFHLRSLEKAIKAPIRPATARSVDTEVFTKKMAFGLRGELTVAQALTQFSTKKSTEIVQVVRDGITQGLTNHEIRRNLAEVTTKVQATQANTLIRTIVNHTSTAAKRALFKANSDVIKAEKYTAVLDGRTSEVCRSLDGKTFPIGTGPRPPMHWSCRSVMTPVIKPEHDILPGVKTNRAARGPDGKTQSIDGRTNYNSWMKKQPKAFQEEVLGIKKAKLFREGNLPIDKFVDKNFKTLNLEQLKRREPLAFDKAGL